MNTTVAQRLAAAIAAFAVTAMLFSTVLAQATPPVPGSFLSQADTAIER